MIATTTYISIAEAAARLGVNSKTVRRRIADGTLTAYRVGPALVRLDPAELDGLLRPIPTAAAPPRTDVTILLHQLRWLVEQHSPYGGLACRSCLVADGYRNCSTWSALTTALIPFGGSETAAS